MATFVGVGEIGRAGIFAIPSSQIRPISADPVSGSLGGGTPYTPPEAGPVPQLTSWPACALPSAPGDMIMVADPAMGHTERASCDAPYTTPNERDLISTREKGGRQKLVVAMPDEGGIIVLDAQTIMNLPPGSFGACPVERWVPLKVDLAGLGNAQPPPTPGKACVNPAVVTPPLQTSYTARPGGISYASGVLYVADIAAPVVHVIDLLTPCDPVERAPLLPTSAEQPARVVTTSRVAAAPFPTPDLRRFVYATDVDDGSIMTFDVGPGAVGRRPLVRAGALFNPLQPRDRIRFAAPAADIIIVQRDIPETNPITGIAVAGVRCDPNPFLVTCTATSTSCDIAGSYQTHTGVGDVTDYTAGAGPLKLRGEFAYAALTNGKIAVIDIDDFDAACRGPAQPDPILGFPAVGSPCVRNSDCGSALCVQNVCQGCTSKSQCPPAPLVSSTPPYSVTNESVCSIPPKATSGTCFAANKTSLELSHLVVEPNAPRAANYEVQLATIGNHVPGLVTFPLLYSSEGSLVSMDEKSPRMIGLTPAGSLTPPLFVGGSPATPDQIAASHALNMNYEDPRAQVADQTWTAIFEGGLPGFDQRLATLRLDLGKPQVLFDPNSRFCDLGVLGQGAMTDILDAANADVTRAPQLADYVQVLSDLPGDQSAYWQGDALTGKDICNGAVCTYTECLEEFGALDQPLPARDLRIVEAYQDHVQIELRTPQTRTKACTASSSVKECGTGNPCMSGFCQVPLSLNDLCCCLPDATSFAVRGGDQWIVIGDGTGFVHHVVADVLTGKCRNTCDPYAARKNGRVIEASQVSLTGSVPSESDFQSPMFHFAILSPQSTGACDSKGVCPTPGESCTADKRCVWPSLRDMNFRFTTNGSFTPLLVNLATDPSALILPQALAYVSSTGELVVTDGSTNGLIFVSLSSATLTRSFF